MLFTIRMVIFLGGAVSLSHLAKVFLMLVMTSSVYGKQSCPNYKVPATGTDNKKLEIFFKNAWDDFMKDAPEWGYDLGYKELGDRWSDESLAAIEYRLNKLDCLKTEMGKIKRSQLSEANKISYDIYSQDLDMYIAAKKFPSHLLSMNQLSGIHSDVVDTLLNMPLNNKVEVSNVLKRLEKVSQKIAEHKILLQEGLKAGVTNPQVVLKKIPDQFDVILKDNPKESVLFKPFAELKSLDEASKNEIQQQALKIIQESLYPVFKDFKNFLVTEYIPKSRQTTSIQALPNGKEWYDWRIRRQTSTNLTADQIHEIGLGEVARILKEMEEIKVKTGFKKDLKAFNAFLLSDSKFYYTKSEDLIRGYREISKIVDAELPKLFKTLPRLTYGVREIPHFKAQASPTAYYMPGSQSAGRAGFFEANTYDLKTRPKWGMEALTLHEAVPGHHLQIALAQELGELPNFRKYGGYTAFVEGWGLYAESLGSEMGFYQDPYSKYGQLTYEMWRAVRLVVDTGLHSKDWSRDKALKYFMDHMPKSQLESEVEIDRYIVWPGQALAYKIGELKFQELRKLAKAELQDKFDIREFHDVALSGGALPLNLLESRVKNWISKEKTKPAAKKML